jgi:hypothetical protein
MNSRTKLFERARQRKALGPSLAEQISEFETAITARHGEKFLEDFYAANDIDTSRMMNLQKRLTVLGKLALEQARLTGVEQATIAASTAITPRPAHPASRTTPRSTPASRPTVSTPAQAPELSIEQKMTADVLTALAIEIFGSDVTAGILRTAATEPEKREALLKHFYQLHLRLPGMDETAMATKHRRGSDEVKGRARIERGSAQSRIDAWLLKHLGITRG